MPHQPKPLVFFGASAFPEISEIVRDINRESLAYRIVGILDDNVSIHNTTIEHSPVLGPLTMAKDYEDALFVLGIGSYRARLVRYDIIKRLGIAPERYATLIHPAAKVYSSSSVGYGCIIYPGAVIFSNSTIENFVQVLANTVIGANNLICEGALITSLVTTTTHVVIGHYTHIGTGCCIGEYVKVGSGAQVAMGSLVLRDIPPGVFSLGNPPRFLDKVDVPLELLKKWNELSCPS